MYRVLYSDSGIDQFYIILSPEAIVKFIYFKINCLSDEEKALTLSAQIATKVVCFLVCCNVLEASMANFVDPGQTAPI